MMASRWMDRLAHVDDDLGARFVEASDAVAARLHDANQALLRRGTAGLVVARDFGDEMLGGARRMSRSTRHLVAERPLETALLVGVAGFAIGWLIRRMREPAPRAVARAPRTTRQKPRSK
jgi:hypothetical protein